jgi:uncharacterized protein
VGSPAKDRTTYVYAIPIGERVLLYAPITGLLALVNDAAALEIRRFLRGTQSHQALPSSLADRLPELMSAGDVDPIERQGSLAPVFLGLIPSRRCNMACRYCDFRDSATGSQVMAPAVAAHAIDFMVASCEQRNQRTCEIQLFGGEPFVEDEVVDVAVHHALMLGARTGITPRFGVSTNGLMRPSRRRFVANYFHRVLLSFDGFREFHDRHRPVSAGGGSFEQVVEAAHDLRAGNAELCIRCCVTADSVPHMEAMARWFCESFRPAAVNFEPVTEGAESRVAGLLPPDPREFARHAFRSWEILRSYACEPAFATVLTDGVQNSSCPVGKDAVIVHPDGTLASCYLLPSTWQAHGLDMSIGRIAEDGTVEIQMPEVIALRRLIEDHPHCAACFCRPTCAGGCHVRSSELGSSADFPSSCVATRALTALTLLQDLGQPDLAEQLLGDSTALDRLSALVSDRAVDFEVAP